MRTIKTAPSCWVGTFRFRVLVALMFAWPCSRVLEAQCALDIAQIEGEPAVMYLVVADALGNTLLGGAAREVVGGFRGSAWIFESSGNTWGQVTELLAPDGGVNDEFGAKALSGSRVACGAPGLRSVYIFENQVGVWSFATKIERPTSEAFGASVDLDGDTLVVGVMNDSANRGAAYVYEFIGGQWMETRVVPSGTQCDTDLFGYSVAISGDVLAVGAPGAIWLTGPGVCCHTCGAVYIFERTGGLWNQTGFFTEGQSVFDDGQAGWDVDTNGQTVLVGRILTPAAAPGGKVLVYDKIGGVWTPTATFRPDDPFIGAAFGRTLSLEGDQALVGRDPGPSDNGAAYVFERQGGEWVQRLRLLAPENNLYGRSLHLDNGRMFIGAPFDGAAGVIYVYEGLGSTASYCTGAPNSVGPGGVIVPFGGLSITSNDFALRAGQLPPNRPALFYYGAGQTQVPFGNGLRCVSAGGIGTFRLGPPLVTNGAGTVNRLVDFTQPPAGSGAGRIEPGSTWYFQLWYRDPDAGGANFNLTDALEATFCP